MNGKRSEREPEEEPEIEPKRRKIDTPEDGRLVICTHCNRVQKNRFKEEQGPTKECEYCGKIVQNPYQGRRLGDQPNTKNPEKGGENNRNSSLYARHPENEITDTEGGDTWRTATYYRGKEGRKGEKKGQTNGDTWRTAPYCLGKNGYVWQPENETADTERGHIWRVTTHGKGEDGKKGEKKGQDNTDPWRTAPYCQGENGNKGEKTRANKSKGKNRWGSINWDWYNEH